MSQAQQVPQEIRQKVHKVINLLLTHGLEYQSTLSESDSYEFLHPKSKYYRYYTSQLYEHGPTSRERLEATLKKSGSQRINIEGTLETISVGAMVQIIKNQLAQVFKSLRQNNREYYQPFEHEYYEENIELAPKNENINIKIQQIIAKYAHLINKKTQKSKDKQKQKKDSKQDEVRKEMGAYQDGSLGAYGGKKYEGLGARDQFDTFRRQKSQSYYLNLQEKSK